ncbi:MAG: ATP-binding cassette domain-containing protein [Clostridia bacterium]|nr:ATP-binding cassette domain-containing protein [Oscillospiraceae bacterium]MBQ6796912.1 ATP-binding cassette domain-containing protein [Clostridia bacterium]
MDYNATAYNQSDAFGAQGIRYTLLIVEPGNNIRVHNIDKASLTIGRQGPDAQSELTLNSKIVSRRHGCFSISAGQLFYTDYPNLNGTYINGAKIQRPNEGQSQPMKLKDGDILRIDSGDLSRPHSDGIIMLISCAATNMERWCTLPLAACGETVLIGRNVPAGNICIPKVTVSRQHAKITRTATGLFVEDCGSQNGTLLNGAPLRGRQPLKDRDVLIICATKIVFTGGMFVYNVPEMQGAAPNFTNVPPQGGRPQNVPPVNIRSQGGCSIRVERISRDVKSKEGGMKRILEMSNNSITINPGELVAIIGGSGAGKTTFMNCINGYEPATGGRVFVNGIDLYQNYNNFKMQIGYVPQQDIVHNDLTVESMLRYTAKLRLPSDLTAAEIEHRVTDVLGMIGLQEHRKKMISSLSGGQKKRASIAVELISDPVLFFLDEPTSGLDPETEKSLMDQLKALATQRGKTVILVTHTLQNAHLFDKIIFLAPGTPQYPGGKLAYYGSYKGALNYFGVENLNDAFAVISSNPMLYVNRFLQTGGAAL